MMSSVWMLGVLRTRLCSHSPLGLDCNETPLPGQGILLVVVQESTCHTNRCQVSP